MSYDPQQGQQQPPPSPGSAPQGWPPPPPGTPPQGWTQQGWTQQGPAPGWPPHAAQQHWPAGPPGAQPPGRRGSVGALVMAIVPLAIAGLLWLLVGVLSLIDRFDSDFVLTKEYEATLNAQGYSYDTYLAVAIPSHAVEIIGAMTILAAAGLLMARKRLGFLLAAIGNGVVVVALIIHAFTVLTLPYANVFNNEDGRLWILALGLIGLGLTFIRAVRDTVPPKPAPTNVPPGQPWPPGHPGAPPGGHQQNWYPPGQYPPR